MSNLLHIRSVYNKAHYNIYETSFSETQKLDLDLIPVQFIKDGKLKSEKDIVNEFNDLTCPEQNLIKYLVSFYNQSQLAFNYVNYNKCGCNYKINWTNYGNITSLNYKQQNDMYTFMHTPNSNMMTLLKILFKIQKYIYSNYRSISAC